MADTHRWPASWLSKEKGRPIEGSICATIWPTRALASGERWFDELYLWTEGFNASTTQRARIQAAALDTAFQMLECEKIDRVGATLSFGTVERLLDYLVGSFEAHELVSHRIAILLRGSIQRMRSRYRIRVFRDHLRDQNVLVGYLLTAADASMERRALEFLQPDFARLVAPNSSRREAWEDLMLEAQVAGVPTDRLIVSGLHSRSQVELAVRMGIPFGQGSAVVPSFAPPHLPRATSSSLPQSGATPWAP